MEIFKNNKVDKEVAYSPENLLEYSIKAKDPDLEDLADSITDPEVETYLFDNGWLMLYHVREDRRLDISNIYINHNGRVSSKQAWDNIVEYAKYLRCDKLSLCTDRNPKPYEHKYGFRAVKTYMEKIL